MAYRQRREKNSRATYRVAVSTGVKKNAGTDARVRATFDFNFLFNSFVLKEFYFTHAMSRSERNMKELLAAEGLSKDFRVYRACSEIFMS